MRNCLFQPDCKRKKAATRPISIDSRNCSIQDEKIARHFYRSPGEPRTRTSHQKRTQTRKAIVNPNTKNETSCGVCPMAASRWRLVAVVCLPGPGTQTTPLLHRRATRDRQASNFWMRAIFSEFKSPLVHHACFRHHNFFTPELPASQLAREPINQYVFVQTFVLLRSLGGK